MTMMSVLDKRRNKVLKDRAAKYAASRVVWKPRLLVALAGEQRMAYHHIGITNV